MVLCADAEAEAQADMVWSSADVIVCSAVSHNSRYLAVGLTSGFITVWDRHTGRTGRTDSHTHTNTHTHIHIYTHSHKHKHKHTHTHTHSLTHTAHKHTRAHTHTHTVGKISI